MEENKGMTPEKATTSKKICELSRDNISTGKSWILIDEKGVDICNQVPGHSSTGSVRLTRKEFEKFIRFYQTGKTNQ